MSSPSAFAQECPGQSSDHQHLQRVASQVRQLAPTYLVILPPERRTSLEITASLATKMIRLGRREGWCPERGGLPVTIAKQFTPSANCSRNACVFPTRPLRWQLASPIWRLRVAPAGRCTTLP